MVWYSGACTRLAYSEVPHDAPSCPNLFNCCATRWRYSYLKGRSSSPWSRGVIQNIRELFNPTEDWKHYYDLPASMLPAPKADLLV